MSFGRKLKRNNNKPSFIAMKPIKLPAGNTYTHEEMLEISEQVARDAYRDGWNKGYEQGRKRTLIRMTARFMDSGSYVLMKRWEALQSVSNRLFAFWNMVMVINGHGDKSTPELDEVREEMFRQTGMHVVDEDTPLEAEQ